MGNSPNGGKQDYTIKSNGTQPIEAVEGALSGNSGSGAPPPKNEEGVYVNLIHVNKETCRAVQVDDAVYVDGASIISGAGELGKIPSDILITVTKRKLSNGRIVKLQADKLFVQVYLI